jgi:glucan endo-1,3-alpha-glucosidase
MDGNQNWYRRGELNLATRIHQVLSLAPDFLEILTWNDAGESHYFGKIWPDSIAGSNIHTYTDGYDHSGWQTLLPPLIKAYKAGTSDLSTLMPSNGKAVSGVFWYRPLLTTGSCAIDSMGKPRGWANAEDNFNLVVLADARASHYTINIYSGRDILARYHPVQGLNSWSIPGIKTGSQRVEVVDIGGRVVSSGTGPMDVVGDISSGVCNYNYQVVGF